MSFSDFNLQASFIKSIEAAGYQSPTPLQSQLIPLLAEKKSAVVWTQSASGKTGAFLIPSMNYILENPAPEKRGARVLILTSRRDRVSQINYTIKRLSQDHTMRFGFIVSGRPYQTQMRLMRRPLDIMIATPGRLNDLMSNGKADFSQLEMLIIDDLTSIYKKNLHGLVEQIIKQAGDDCTTLTFVSNDDETSEYAESLFPDAVQISVDDEDGEAQQDSSPEKHSHNQNTKQHSQNADQQAKNTTEESNAPKPAPVNKIEVPDHLTPQKVHIADDYTHKIAMMDHLMDEFAGESTLIYTATTKAAKTLQENLSNHGHAAELIDDVDISELNDIDILIHSDQQKTTLESDAYSQIDTHIIHFDLPRKTEQYIKRLTNHQQSNDKEVLLMLDGYNFNELKHIEKTLGETLEQITVPGLEPLNPFVNLSKGRPSHNKKSPNTNRGSNQRNNQNKAGQRNPRSRNSNQKNGKQNNNPRNKAKNTKGKNPRTNSSNNQNANGENSNDEQRRQRKGPFGRLNGGAQRKKSGGRDNNSTNNRNNQNRNRSGGRHVKVGVSTRGTAPPPGSGDRGWKATVASPQERKPENSKPVVIRYSKKRILEDKPED